jgi:hypothetical protein
MSFTRQGHHHERPSGNFIFQNYCQALERIETDSEHLVLLGSKLATTSDDYEAYLNSEHEYLSSLCAELVEDIRKADYIELLTKLYPLQYVAPTVFLHATDLCVYTERNQMMQKLNTSDFIRNGYTRKKNYRCEDTI